MPVPLHLKSFLFEQINRTLPSRNKLAEMKIIDSNLCIKCNIKANTEHVLLNCVFSKYFINSLAKFLDKLYNNSQPEFIFMKENFYLFNMHYDVFSDDDYLQLTLMILIAKERLFKINIDECFTYRWNNLNFFSQSLSIAQQTCTIFENLGKSCNIIEQYLNYLFCYKNVVQFFYI